MKYSIRGRISTTDEQSIISVINSYELWKLEAGRVVDSLEDGNISYFHFEVWVNTEQNKNSLFNDLKPFVDEYGEMIDWHECTHDEPISQPCRIVETYVRGE